MLHNRLARLREERTEGDRGFTLIELLVVVVIIGVLIAIAIPLYLNYKKGANDKAAQSDLRGAVSVMEQCNSDTGSYPTSLGANGGTPGGGCTGTVTVSTGTTLRYVAATNSFMMASTNTNGSGKIWCYNASNGGSIKDVSAAGVTLANATC